MCYDEILVRIQGLFVVLFIIHPELEIQCSDRRGSPLPATWRCYRCFFSARGSRVDFHR